jgi:hypothetical protein
MDEIVYEVALVYNLLFLLQLIIAKINIICHDFFF